MEDIVTLLIEDEPLVGDGVHQRGRGYFLDRLRPSAPLGWLSREIQVPSGLAKEIVYDTGFRITYPAFDLALHPRCVFKTNWQFRCGNFVRRFTCHPEFNAGILLLDVGQVLKTLVDDGWQVRTNIEVESHMQVGQSSDYSKLWYDDEKHRFTVGGSEKPTEVATLEKQFVGA